VIEMRQVIPNPVRLIAVAAVASLALVAACSSNGGSDNAKSNGTSTAGGGGGAGATSTAAAGGSAGAAAPLKNGTLTIGTSADFPPMMIRDTSDPTKVNGFENDMVTAIMKHLGQQYQIKISSFSGLIPAIQAGQLDMVVSDVFVTAERQKTVDFVPYMKSGLSVLVSAKNGPSVHSYSDLCGKAVGVVTGSPSEVEAADGASKQCEAAGKSALTVTSLPSVPDELTQIGNGRLFAIIEDELSLAYVQQQQPGKYAVPFTDPSTATKIGIVVAKGSSIEAPLQQAVDWYLASPQYKTDAKKWGIPDSALLASTTAS
jgi:polar amino acid transport system substrate-binding protein